MTKYFYAKDHANGDQLVQAFTQKSARDGFVGSGNQRFAITAKEADDFCARLYEATARDAVKRGFI